MLQKLKKKLEAQRQNILRQLEKFATKDKKLKGDWDTRFPNFNSGQSSSSTLEQEADEVEEYTTLLPIEYALELQLKNINIALEKIKIGKYGICEKCKHKITPERLEACPEAKVCNKCKKSNNT